MIDRCQNTVDCFKNNKFHFLDLDQTFSLGARKNGVLERNGHTEGSIDLMKLAGLEPQAVLCELMNADGIMAKLDKIINFAQQHDLIVLSIEDIVYYRKFVRDYNKL